jgi:hypothetical protein
MKQLLALVATLLCVAFFTDCFAQSSPYTATYSSSFKIGKPTYSTMILNLWKDWDDNTFDRHDYFADTVVMYLPDGTVVHGKAASLEGAKKYRGTMASCKSMVHGWVPLTSIDQNEDAVCVWGTEVDTFADGKVERRDLHEVWWFNKEGKIARMRQWAAAFGQ